MSTGQGTITIVCSADAGYVLPLTVMLVSVRSPSACAPAPRRAHHSRRAFATQTKRAFDVRSTSRPSRFHGTSQTGHGGSSASLWVDCRYAFTTSCWFRTSCPRTCALFCRSTPTRLCSQTSLRSGTRAPEATPCALSRTHGLAGLVGYGRGRVPRVGASADAKYFNCGVMLMNVHRWRQRRVSDRALAYLKPTHTTSRSWSRKGIEAVLSDRWGSLDPQWTWSVSVGGAFRQRSVDAHVKIAHFSGNLKPWKPDGGNPYYALYYEYVGRTAFAGFRPRRRWHTAALRSYEQAAFRRILLPSEQWGIKMWRAFTGRVATPQDVRMTR